jgi:hypothetical protein
LSEFYTTGVNTEVVTDQEFRLKKATEDIKGLWVLDRMNSAAKEFGITRFVDPLDEEGRELPGILPIEVYFTAFSLVSSEWIIDLEENSPFRDMMGCLGWRRNTWR